MTFTRFVAPAEPTGAWRTYYEQWAFALQPPDAPLWDVVPELPGWARVERSGTPCFALRYGVA